MPTVNPSPFGPCPQFESATGAPAVGDKLFFYVAGSNTKQDTYTTAAGTTANANPIVLNSLGQPSTEIWFTSGQIYKMVWAPSTDTDPPASPIRTWDNLRGMGDVTTTFTVDQWITYGAAATYISGTSFSVVGNQTTTFQIGRRVKTTNSGGTVVYSTITNSVFGVVTTVTLSNDSGSLDSGLSAVAYGIVSADNTSAPATLARLASPAFTGTPTAPTASAADASTTVATTAYVDRVVSKITPVGASAAAGALTVTINPCVLDFRSTTLTSGTVTTLNISGAISVTVPSGGTLGAPTTVSQRMAILAINNAGTVEAAIVNVTGGVLLDEAGTINTTAVGAGSTSATTIYSTSARTGVAYRVVGYVDAVNTAGAWGSPTLVQGAGGQGLAPLTGIGNGQTWQVVTGSRTAGVTYYNTTGKPIALNVRGSFAGGTLAIGGVTVGVTNATADGNVFGIVPPGQSYSMSGGFTAWAEMR